MAKQLRFVILEHDHPTLHWDFMLESGGVLRTWRLLEEPGASRAVPAEPIVDHRIEYLDYEGPVSGDRGRVVRWDAGTYRTVTDRDGTLRASLSGGRFDGEVVITGGVATFSS